MFTLATLVNCTGVSRGDKVEISGEDLSPFTRYTLTSIEREDTSLKVSSDNSKLDMIGFATLFAKGIGLSSDNSKP